MRSLLIAFTAIVVLGSAAKAQVPLDYKQLQLNAGFGVGSWGLPIYAGLDYGLSDEITVGGEVAFSSFDENTGNYGEYTHTVFQMGGRGDYHFTMLLGLPSHIDVYAGANAGFAFFNTKVKSVGLKYQGDNGSGMYLGLHIGGRYFFNDTWAANLQLGGGSFFGSKVGITYIL